MKTALIIVYEREKDGKATNRYDYKWFKTKREAMSHFEWFKERRMIFIDKEDIRVEKFPMLGGQTMIDHIAENHEHVEYFETRELE